MTITLGSITYQTISSSLFSSFQPCMRKPATIPPGRRQCSWFSVAILYFLTIGFGFSAKGQYSLDSFVIGPGETSTGGNYSLASTIEEAEPAATISGGTYSMETSFSSITAVATPSAPSLTIQRTATNTVIVSWPAMADDYELRENSNLNTPNWTVPPQVVNTSGGNKSIVVNPPSGNHFYRLSKTNPATPFPSRESV